VCIGNGYLYGGVARISGTASGEEAVEEEQDDCAGDSDGEATEVELGDKRPVGQDTIEKAANQGAGDAEEHCNDTAAGVLPTG
jgi:hypothetical protein